MQIVPLSRSLTTWSTSPSRRKNARPQPASRARLGNAADFEPLAKLVWEDFIEGEFQDAPDESANPDQQSYLGILFPKFAMKSRYVNYYV